MEAGDTQWMRSSPGLRFSYRPQFLQCAGDAASLHAARTDLRPSRRDDNDLIIHQKSSLRRPLCNSYAATIARAAASHKRGLRASTVHRVRELRDASAEARRGRDVERQERGALGRLLGSVRQKCALRLRELGEPAEVLRAVDGAFMRALLARHQGCSLSVDALLECAGRGPPALPPLALGGDVLFAECSAPPRLHRAASPVRLLLGAGYRPLSPADLRPIAAARVADGGAPGAVHYSLMLREGGIRAEGGAQGMNFADSLASSEVHGWALVPPPRKTPLCGGAMDDEDSAGGRRGGGDELAALARASEGACKQRDRRGVWRHTSGKRSALRPFFASS